MEKTLKLLPVILLFLLATSRLAYLETQQQDDSDFLIRLSTKLVVLDTQVINKKTGSVISNLKKEDFSVFEDGTKQDVTHFSRNKLPLSIVFLMDMSGSVQPVIKQISEGALKSLAHLKPEDEVALMAFASTTELTQDFTRDRQIIIDKIKTINETAKVGGSTVLDEAIYQAALHLKKSSNPVSRRVIIALTDNVPCKPFFRKTHSEKEAFEELFESGSVVCGLIVRGWAGKVNNITEKRPDAILFRKLRSIGNLNTYAERTGGTVLKPKKEELEAKLFELIDRLRTRYTLGYMPSNQSRNGKLRKIKLTVSPDVEKREGKLAILTKRGYYAR